MASALKNQNWLGALKVLPEHFQNLTQCKIVATIFKKKQEQKTDDDLSSCIQKHILNAFFVRQQLLTTSMLCCFPGAFEQIS